MPRVPKCAVWVPQAWEEHRWREWNFLNEVVDENGKKICVINLNLMPRVFILLLLLFSKMLEASPQSCCYTPLLMSCTKRKPRYIFFFVSDWECLFSSLSKVEIQPAQSNNRNTITSIAKTYNGLFKRQRQRQHLNLIGYCSTMRVHFFSFPDLFFFSSG